MVLEVSPRWRGDGPIVTIKEVLAVPANYWKTLNREYRIEQKNSIVTKYRNNVRVIN